MTHGRQKSRIERQMATLMILMAQNAVTCWYIGRFVPIFFCLSYYIGKTDGSSRVSPYPTCAYRPQNRAYHQYTDNRKNLPSASHTHTPNIHSGTPALTKIAKMFSIIICCCSAIYYECLMGKDYMYNSYVFVYIFVLPRAQCICMWPSFRSSEFIQMLIRQRY